jgi:hypothetical protein
MFLVRILVLLLVVTVPSFCQLVKTEVLFILYDLGETQAVKPLMNILQKNGTGYKILAFGKSSEAFPSDPNCIPLPISEPDILKWDRTKKLPESVLSFLGTIQCKVAIAGMASCVQAQAVNLFKSKGAYTIAVYDNFDSPSTKDFISAFISYEPKVHELWVPSKPVYDGFSKDFKPFWSQMYIMGQPALESWQHVFATTDRASIREELDINTETTCVLFVGGYDDTYEEALKVFLESTHLFQDKDVQFIISPHPKTSGELEKKLVDELPNDCNILIPTGYSTSELATIANLVVCHKSTVGILALYQGVPVVYVAKKSDYSNFSIQEGNAIQVEKAHDLVDTISDILNPSKGTKKSFESLGIPTNASKVMSERIMQRLEKAA